jgi:hypothetical protein
MAADLPKGRLTLESAGRVGLLAALALAALSAGCVLLDQQEDNKPPPPGVPCQVVATWQNHVLFAADPVHNGAQTPGLAGRLYLFGPEIGFPMTGDGSLVVDVYDETKEGQSLMLEQWRLDPKTLAMLLRKDMVGWGYTLFLPWGRYRPDISRVRMKVRYDAPRAAPIFCESVVTLAPENGVITPRSTPLQPTQVSVHR